MGFRDWFIHKQTPIILTTQFDESGFGMFHLDSTTTSSMQLDRLIQCINKYFDAPAEIDYWSQKKVLHEMPTEYLEGIKFGKYDVDTTGGIIPNWGYKKP